jgi:hypothetical protein
MLLPNRSRASSAASSARSMSFRRLAASERKRETIDCASLTISAGSDSGRSGCSFGSRSLASSAPAAAASSSAASSGFVSESDRVRFMSSVSPVDACVLAAAACFWASV